MNRLLAVDKPPTCAGEWLMPPGLSDFLLARIAEDEEVARAATPSAAAECPGMGWNPSVGSPGLAAIYGGPLDEAGYRTQEVFRFSDAMDCEECVRPSDADLVHMARFDPARVLTDCASKRRVVERYQKIQGRRQDGDLDERLTLGWVLEQMALTYAGHPDYDETWRPGL